MTETAAQQSKVVASAAEAVRVVQPGMRVMVGGFAMIHSWPNTLLQALADHGAGGLTLIANNMGFGRYSPQVLAERKLVKALIGSFGGFGGRETASENQILAGEMTFEIVPQGTFAERIRAGGAGLPAFYVATSVGTPIAEGKETRIFDGRTYVLESALHADVALIRATTADELGNLRFDGVERNFNTAMAMAADYVIVEAAEIVPAGTFAPEDVHVASIFVDAVVCEEIPRADVLAEVLALGKDPLRVSRPAREQQGLPRELMALRAARLVAGMRYVNLGIGLPTLIGQWLQEIGSQVMLHAENGVLGYVSAELDGWNPNYYNAGGQPVRTIPGAATFDSATAFAMARGGHLDAVVLGGYEVASNGDLANWRIPGAGAGGIGGAMDLIAGRVPVIVVMEHQTRDGASRLVETCTYPLTGAGCVQTVITNLARIDVTAAGFVLREVAPGITIEEVVAATGAPLQVPTDVPVMDL